MGNISMGEICLAAVEKFVEEDDPEQVGVTEAEANYFDRMMEIDNGKTVMGEILATAIERNGGGADEEFQTWAIKMLGEVIAVGAGIGGGIENTAELRVMKFEEAMAGDDKENWQKAVDEEHDRMVKRKVWKAVLKKDVPAAAKILTSTWAMKKKANGTYRARLNARGFEQQDGQHFDKYDIAAPVTSDITIRVVLVIMIIAGWTGELLDIRGAFLHGDFKPGEKLYMKVPKGFEKHYDPRYYVLLLLQTIYGLKQAAMAFWKKLLECFSDMNYDRCKADP
eukprot:scaffold4869_cov71-Cylindrotheca_fusiformis.AAC.1